MKLYDVPHNTRVKVYGDIKVPPDGKEIHVGDVLEFKHIDGMYSYCIDSEGDIVHLVSWAEVYIL
jgi:hypothetical protein